MATTASDLVIDGVMAVMERAFDPEYNEAWTRRQVTDALALPSGHLIAVDAAGHDPSAGAGVAGFTLSRAAPGEEELLLVAVDPEYRGRGLASRLIERLKAEAAARGGEKLFLEVREDNPARTLYERCGFEPIGRRKQYYRTRSRIAIDAITYGCPLDIK